MPNTNDLTRLFMISSIFAASIAMQAMLFLNWDVASLLSATQVLLAGGKYATDIFTPNPPMILYLYIPPVLMSKFFGLNIIDVFRVYIYLICGLSLFASYACIRQYFNDKPINMTYLFIGTLAFSYLVLPIYEFGNRDHLLLVLTLPYLLMVVLRLDKKPVSSLFAFMVAISAGIGFAIKPQFLATLFLVEIYYLYKNKSWLANIRIETVVMAVIFAIYGLTTLIFQPGLITVIFPFLMRNYYSTIGQSFYGLTVYPLTLFCFMALILSLSVSLKMIISNLFAVLVLALVGFVFSIYAQHTLFYYHFIPAVGISLLLTLMTLKVYIECNDKSDNIRMGLLAILFCVCNIYLYPLSWYNIVYYPTYFFAFFMILFMSLLGLSNKYTFLSVVARGGFIVSAGLLLALLLVDYDVFNHQFMLVLTMMSVLYLLLAGYPFSGIKKQVVIVVLAISLFYVPAMQGYRLFIGPREFKVGPLEVMTTFIKSRGSHQSIYSFSPAIYFTFPAIFYANASSGQRFDQLWPIIGFSKKNQTAAKQDREFFMKMVAEDLQKNKPDLIFLDNVNVNPSSFNYVTFFSESPDFRQEWKSYRYLTTLNLGKLNSKNAIIPVYERIK